MHWHPADHRLDAGHSDYKFMCKACGTGWPEAANQCWVCPGKEFVPFQAPSATYEADGVTYNLLIVEGKPTWIQQRDGGSLGAAGPGGTWAQADRNLVDGTILGAKHVFWASVECGLVLPSISAWEVVGKEKFKTTGGYMCRFCASAKRAVGAHGCSRLRGGTRTRPPACSW